MFRQVPGKLFLEKMHLINMQKIEYQRLYHHLQPNITGNFFDSISTAGKKHSFSKKIFLQTNNFSDEKKSIVKQSASVQDCIKDVNSVSIVDEFRPNLPASFKDGDWDSEMKWIRSQEQKDLFSEPSCPSEIDNVTTALRPTFNLAAYVNKSNTLQKMVDLGVDLNKLEKRRGIASFILKLDFELDMKNHISFLYNAGVDGSELGWFITINPLIFNNDLEDLEARVNYLESKQFSKQEISRIITKNPFWLQFSTHRIDGRLGFFQRTFELIGSEVRQLATKQPKLITQNLHHIKRTTFAVQEEMGFSSLETKQLLLVQPKIWLSHGVSLLRRFDYIHTEMGLQHSQIIKFPQLLGQRDFRLHQRHSFLKALGRNQYNPTEPGYISPLAIVEGNDVHFSINCAKTSVQAFNDFCKTI